MTRAFLVTTISTPAHDDDLEGGIFIEQNNLMHKTSSAYPDSEALECPTQGVERPPISGKCS